MYSKLRALCIIVLMLTIMAIGASAQQQEDERYKIQWRDYTFDTNRPLPPMAKALTLEAYPETVQGYYFVQFTGPITKDMKTQAIASGAELLNYVPNNAYIVRMDAAIRTKVEVLSIVQWVGIFQPAMRVSSRFLKRIEGVEIEAPRVPYPLKFEKPETEPVQPAPLQLTILAFKGEDLEKVGQAVVRAGGTVLVAQESERWSRLRVRCPSDKLYDLARINGVMWIEEFKWRKLYNDAARGVMDVTAVWNGHGLRGNGQIIGVGDGGLDSGVDDATMHDDIEGRIVNIFSWPVQAAYGVANTGADDGASDVNDGHGTHVTGSVLGNGTLSVGIYTGVAPEAMLVFQGLAQWTNISDPEGNGYYLTGIPLNLNDLFQQAYDEGARIHTNSWGGGDPGEYDSYSEDVDEFVWNHPDMLILFAAGNDGSDDDQNNVIDLGSVTSPGTAKNCLTVGASENDRSGIPQTFGIIYGPVINADQIAHDPTGMAAFSSRGPANSNTPTLADDRIKPDLVAPGTMVASTRSQAAPNAVWYMDDMESGVSGWTTAAPWAQVTVDAHSANTSWHDSPTGNYADNINISLTSPVQNLSGGWLGTKALTFWYRYDLGTGDTVFLSLIGDGWTLTLPLAAGTQADWELFTFPLGPSYFPPPDSIFINLSDAPNFQVRFRLQSDGDGNTGDGLYIDDVRIVEGAFGSSLLSDQGLARAGSPSDQNYVLMSGTSMATPLTAGAAALVRQYYTDVVGLEYVSAALLRATLINGAAEMSPGQYGTGPNQEMGEKPNNVEGWGRVDLKNSLFPTRPAVLNFVDELVGLETFESRDYSMRICDDSVPIAITMVYHDSPGPGLHNNLDMIVTTPAAEILYPNGRASPDFVNNVEQILIPVGDVQRGTYTITINGYSVPEGPQPFALVISTAQPAAPLQITRLSHRLMVWSWSDEVDEALDKALASFEECYNVEIDRIRLLPQQDYLGRLLIGFASGRHPADVLWVEPEMVASLSEQEHIIELDLLVVQRPELIQGIPDYVLERFRYKGHLYGIPLGAEEEFAFNAYAISSRAEANLALELVLLLRSRIPPAS